MINFAKVAGFPTKIFGAVDDIQWHEKLIAYGDKTFYPQISEQYEAYRREFADWKSFSAHQRKVQDKAIDALGKSPALRKFKKMGMGRFLETPNLPTGDIYDVAQIDSTYLSVDIRQANVTILTHYAPGAFAPYKTYEEWLGQFTKSDFIKGLKEMRLEIFKKSGSWRQGQLQQHLMNSLYAELSRTAPDIAKYAISINRDELIFDITEHPAQLRKAVEDFIQGSRSPIAHRLGTEQFRVVPAGNTGGVYRIGERGTKLKKMQPMYIAAILSLAANDGRAEGGLALEIPMSDGTVDAVSVDKEVFFLLHERIPVEIVHKADFLSTVLGDHPWSWYRHQLDRAAGGTDTV